MIGWIYLVSEWVIRLVMLPIVIRRRHPSAALAWLSVIFFFPWAGLVLYAMLGWHRLGRRSTEKHAEAVRTINQLGRVAPRQAHVAHPSIRKQRRDLVRLTSKLGDMPPLGGNKVDLVSDTAVFIDRLIGEIDSASDHVHLLFYIFRDDATGRRVAQALKRAAARGVKARVLADWVGSRALFARLAPELREAGVDVRPMLMVNPLRALVHRIDLRNHRKAVIIDGRTAYVGSHNIADPDYGHPRYGPWHDMTVHLEGPAVLHAQEVFLEDWYFTTGTILEGDRLFLEPEAIGSVPIQTVPSGPDYKSDVFHHFVVAALHDAEERIVVTSPYLFPDEPMLLALQIASYRGVRVDLVVPGRSNHGLSEFAARAFYDDLLAAGVNIHLYKPGLLHAKTISIDNDVSIIGSSNFDMRSFYLNFELNLVLYGGTVTRSLVELQESYVELSRPLSLEEWRRRPIMQKGAENLAKLAGPLL